MVGDWLTLTVPQRHLPASDCQTWQPSRKTKMVHQLSHWDTSQRHSTTHSRWSLRREQLRLQKWKHWTSRMCGHTMRSTRILAVVVGAVLLAVGARAATVALNPSQDTTLYEDSTKANSLGTRLFVGHTGEQFNSSRRALLQFDLSSVPAGATITSAELVLYCDKSPMTPVNLNIGLHLVNASWGIGTSVVRTRPYTEVVPRQDCAVTVRCVQCAVSDGLSSLQAPFNTGTSEEGKGTTATTNDTTWTRRFYDTVSWASAGGDYAATPCQDCKCLCLTTFTPPPSLCTQHPLQVSPIGAVQASIKAGVGRG